MSSFFLFITDDLIVQIADVLEESSLQAVCRRFSRLLRGRYVNNLQNVLNPDRVYSLSVALSVSLASVICKFVCVQKLTLRSVTQENLQILFH